MEKKFISISPIGTACLVSDFHAAAPSGFFLEIRQGKQKNFISFNINLYISYFLNNLR